MGCFNEKKQPHPRPLSEWRGEWILLVGCERMISGNRGNRILKLRKRPSRLQKGVSSLWREPFFTPTKCPLYLQTMVFTPLSIRRGAGGEAVVGLGVRLSFICKQWFSLPSPLLPFGQWPLVRRGGEAVVGLGVRLLVESQTGVSFCVFPCSFRNSVSLSGSVPFVYSVLKMP